ASVSKKPAYHYGVRGRSHCRAAWRPLCRFGTIFLAAMLTSCAVGPDFRSPDPPAVTGYLGKRGEAVPGQRLAFGADIPARWWELLQTRHLNERITQGSSYNPDLNAAEAAARV